MPNPPQQPQHPQQPAADAADAAVAAGASVSRTPASSDHIGWGRITAAMVLLIGAAIGCVFALWPTWFGVEADAVSVPEAALALSASGAVGALYFFLSAQVRRTQEETRRLTEDVEQRTEEAVSSLRREVETLHEAVSRRTEERIAATDAAADMVAERPTPGALKQLLDAAHGRGLIHSSARVAVKGLIYLQLQKVQSDLAEIFEDSAPLLLEVREAHPDEDVSDFDPFRPRVRPVERFISLSALQNNSASVVIPEDQPLGDGVADLHEQLLRLQAAWRDFPKDTQQALRHLSGALRLLSHAIEDAEEPLQLGSVEMVLDDNHVLMRTGGGGLKVVPLSDPTGGWSIEHLADRFEPGESNPVLEHPFVAREIQRLRERRRPSGSADAGSRPPPGAV